MVVTLDEIVQAYLADKEFQASRLELARRRDESLPVLQETVQYFIRGEINLETFRSLLDVGLRTGEDWGATGMGFMVQLNILNKYYNDPNSNVDLRFRIILQALNAGAVGQSIEEFYNFLLTERDRLRRAGKSSGMIVTPSRSPFIISLLAFWLDPTPRSIIYYTSLRKGLHRLVTIGAVPTPPDLALSATNVEIRTKAHHEAVNEIVDYLMLKAPELQNGTNYWFESFCYWVGERWQPSALPENTLVAENDVSNLLTKTLTNSTVVREDEEAFNLSPSIAEKVEAEARLNRLLIPHEPLLPTPEPLLTQLIHEVQRHILVDEQLVRRIYHALLAGHVILTGPPGTGKTELARLIPEILWQSKSDNDEESGDNTALSRETAYTTRMVTATDDWSPRTLISGIVPQTINGTISYKVQYGHLTATILKNWSFDGNQPEEWSTLTLSRTRIATTAGTERGTMQTFKGQWLVIDEFNRAPIDLALGDALTALGGNDVLRVPIDNGSAELPIPQDFRIIGTLNSFDRHYLNQISEALKRRFSFVEILPPTRAQHSAEQGIVLYKALKKVSHLNKTISVDASTLYWDGVVAIEADASGQYAPLWEDDNAPFPAAFRAAWRVLEVIRIYRQLGTAQAISLIRHMLIAGILQAYQTHEAWISALDAALCDTIADQLQVLLPDEIEALLLYLTTLDSFPSAYHQLLERLTSTPQRLRSQLQAFSNIVDDNGILYFSDADIERIVAQDQPGVTLTTLQQLFHLDHPRPHLPQFTRRLRAFKAERGL